MKINAWTAQNSQQSNIPRTPVRSISFNVIPDQNGGNPQVSAGKVTGQLTLQNVTPEMASMFEGGSEVEITVTVKPAQGAE